MSLLRTLSHKFFLQGETKMHGVFMLAEEALITIGIKIAIQFDSCQEIVSLIELELDNYT